MANGTKRLLALLLALMMCVSLLPVTALAEGADADEDAGTIRLAEEPDGERDGAIAPAGDGVPDVPEESEDEEAPSSAPTPADEAQEVVASGECGDNLAWILTDDGTLTISGTGDMWDSPLSWNDIKDQIVRIELQEGLTRISSWAFEDCVRLRSVEFPSTVTTIPWAAFYNCTALGSVTIPAFVTKIDSYAFNNTGLTEITFMGNAPEIGASAFAGVTATAYYPSNYYGWTEDTLQDYGGALTWVPYEKEAAEIASGQCGDNLTWTLTDDSTLAISGTGDMWSYQKGKTPWYENRAAVKVLVLGSGVTSIGSYAFYECGMESVVIPEGVTAIGDYAFIGCLSLVHVTLPASVTCIGDYAFSSCLGLKTAGPIGGGYNLEFGWTEAIPSQAFAYCNSLERVTVPESVNKIGDHAFYNCSSMTAVTIPEGVTVIEENTFANCIQLASVTIPESVTSIGIYAFHNCSSLTSVAIPAGVTRIEDYVFENCSSLESVTIPEGVTSLGKDAFYKCSSLTAVTIPESVTSIGGYAFAYCSSLTSIAIPEGVVTIEDRTFYNCSSLASITLPASVAAIESNAFYNCSSLADVYYAGYEQAMQSCFQSGRWSSTGNDSLQNATWHFGKTLEEGWALCGIDLAWQYDPDTGTLTIKGSGAMWDFGNDSVPWQDYCDSIRALAFDGEITRLGDWAFSKCSALTSVTIPESVVTIGDSAFSECTSLTSVTIPEGVIVIEDDAFGCTGLTSVTIPESVTSIGSWAFSTCSKLTSVTIPEGVTSIGESAFSYCSSLTSITLPASVTAINRNTFLSCSKLTSVTITEGVTSIGEYAFRDCNALTSITIPASVTSIENRAFFNCSRLTEIHFAGSAPAMGERCFFLVTATAYYPANNDTWTEEVRQDYGGKLTWVAVTAFGNCGDDLTWILDAEGTLTVSGTGDMWDYTSIGEAFSPWYEMREAITRVVIEDGATGIGNYAFIGCNNMTEISFADSVNRIGEWAFYACGALQEVALPSALREIRDYAFSEPA